MDSTEPGSEMEPLADRSTNVASVKPMLRSVSKLPAPRSRLVPPGSLSRMPVPKRKASPERSEEEETESRLKPAQKRARLATSFEENTEQPQPPPRNTRTTTTTTTSKLKAKKVIARPGGGRLRRSMSTSDLSSAKPRAIATAARRGITAPKPVGGGSVRGGALSRPGASSRPPVSRSAVSRPAPTRTSGSSNTSLRSNRSLTSTTTAKPAPKASAAPATGAAGGKKRAAWDLKGRLLDMEKVMSEHLNTNSHLQDQIASTEDRIMILENLNQQLKGTVKAKEQETTQASSNISQLREKLSQTEHEYNMSKRRWEEEMDEMRRKTKNQISELEFAKSSLERQRASLEDELSSKQQEIAGLKMTVSQLTSAQEGIKAQLEATKMTLSASQADASEKQTTIKRLNQIIADQTAAIESMEERLREHEMTRRKLHNTIQELKGNIRVFCRVRPLLGDEKLGVDEIQHISFNDEDPRMMELEKLADMDPNQSVAATLKHANGRFQFQFDRVFQPTDSQQEVFDEISQLVQSALDGYHVCIFAYGQTGSGKTHTMEGPSNSTLESQGMIPRAVTQIFESVQLLTSQGWSYEFTASFLEIYNESIRDLLGEGKDDTKHEIKMKSTKTSEIYVSNLTAVPVLNAHKVHELLSIASKNRAVAATKCNERSSRSHSVFQLKISGTNSITSDTCEGILNLIDLAGSERLKDSKSEGARLKETQSINKSLSNLGNVIMALGNKDSHIPYRNSKLTHLLMNSLGGNSKTLMFVNVSPREDCFGETLNSLRFATKVNNCNIGTATQKKK